MTLTREDLLHDRTRKALQTGAANPRLLSDEQLEQTRRRALAKWNGRSPIWVFAYGSLIWNPQMVFKRRARAKIFGLRRRLCLWSVINRGTQDFPGIVLGLEPGGSCCGIAFQIEGHHVEHETQLLWRREMLAGSYLPVWAQAHLASGKKVCALTFRVNPQSRGHACNVDEVKVIHAIRSAIGRYGSCADYVGNTTRSLINEGIRDPHLIALCEKAGVPYTEGMGDD